MATSPDTPAAATTGSAAMPATDAQPRADSGRELSALRVKVSKLERLYMLTKKKLEDTSRRSGGLAQQLAAAQAAAARAQAAAAAAKDVEWTARRGSDAALRVLTRDVDDGFMPVLLQCLEVDLGRPSRSGAAGGAGAGNAATAGAWRAGDVVLEADGDEDDDDGEELRRVPLSQMLGNATPMSAAAESFGGAMLLPVIQRWCLIARRRRVGGAAAVAASERAVDVADLGSAVWIRQEDASDLLARMAVGDVELEAVAGHGARASKKIAAKCDRLERQLTLMQDRHREYRIKSEALVRQKEAQVTEAKNKTLALLQKRISGSDLESQLAAAKREVDALTRSYEELQSVDAARRRTTRSLNKELRAAMQTADTWRLRYEEAVREAADQAKAAVATAVATGKATGGSDGGGATASAGGRHRRHGSGGGGSDAPGDGPGAGHRKTWSSGGDADDAAKQLAELTAEYGVYRKRALEIIAKKDQELQQLHARLVRLQGGAGAPPVINPSTPGGGAHSTAAGTASLIGPSASEFDTVASGSEGGASSMRHGFRDDATREYLKNVLMRYMLSSDAAVRSQLEGAIATVVGFSAVEVQRVQRAREAAASGSLWSKATSLFG